MKAKTYSPNYLAGEFNIDRQTAVRALRDVEPDGEIIKGRGTFSIATFARALELHRLFEHRVGPDQDMQFPFARQFQYGFSFPRSR